MRAATSRPKCAVPAKALRRELNLAAEARNMERFAHFVGDEHIVVPRVYWELTNTGVNVQIRRWHPRYGSGGCRRRSWTGNCLPARPTPC